MKNIHKLILSIVIVLALSLVVHGAGNMIQTGDVIALQWSSVGCTTGDPVIKCASKATGGIVGVALKTAAVDTNVSVATKGVFDLTVTSGAAAIVIGDYIFATVVDENTSTAALTNTNTGLIFGQALEAISATGTAAVIKVKLLQPSHL